VECFSAPPSRCSRRVRRRLLLREPCSLASARLRLAEVVGVAPAADYVWVGGYYRWDGSAYFWVPGRWQPAARPYAKWKPGYWRESKSGWYWVPGKWK